MRLFASGCLYGTAGALDFVLVVDFVLILAMRLPCGILNQIAPQDTLLPSINHLVDQKKNKARG
jgi:hypothetical protein